MALWTVHQSQSGKVAVTYDNKGYRQELGRTDAALPFSEFVQWFVQEGDPGDVVVTHNGVALWWSQTERQC